MTEKSRCMLGMLHYAYSLKFEEEPEYSKLKFMLQKLQLDNDYLPDLRFDWLHNQASDVFDQQYNDPLDRHSSISSCSVSEGDMVDVESQECENKEKKLEDSHKKNGNFMLLWEASIGNSQIYYKIPEDFVKVGEFQYLPKECVQVEEEKKQEPEEDFK